LLKNKILKWIQAVSDKISTWAWWKRRGSRKNEKDNTPNPKS